MKLRNLFLASVACAGLFTACSNVMDEVVDNNGNGTNTEGEAYVQIGFAMPASSTTARAASTDEGLATERGITNVAIVIANGGTVVDYIEKTNADFAPDQTTGGQPGANNERYYVSKSPIEVTKSTTASDVYVFVNPTGQIKTLYAKGKTIAAAQDAQMTDGLAEDLTTVGKIANDNNFLMANVGGIAESKIMNGTKAAPISVVVKVERAVAKLVEKTTDRAFNVDNKGGLDAANELKITFKNYAYYNLNKSSYILPHFDGTNVKDTNYGLTDYSDAFYRPNATTTDFSGYDAKMIGEKNAFYCLENTDIAANQWTDKTTGIIYKAEAQWGSNPVATFYVYLGKVFLSWGDLKTEYAKTSNSLDDADKDSYDKLIAKGITLYKDGVCYYRVAIKHDPKTEGELAAMEFAVVRNNLYNAYVNKVSGLGDPFVPTTPEPDRKDKAYITLQVDVMPWVVRDSGFDL